LHGLWASTPAELKARHMPDPIWWRYGCYWYRPDHAIPQGACSNAALNLPPPLHARLWAAMPAAATCLDRHEYFKHAQCLGFEPAPFFTQALGLLDAVNANPFTAWVRAHRGQTVSRAALLKAFQRSFKLDASSALELRCGRRESARREDVLVQAWMTLRSDRLAQFPAASSFTAGRRGNCPARILIAR
jgi:ribonuclease I